MSMLAIERAALFLRATWIRHWALLIFLLMALTATFFSIDHRQSINTQLPLLAGLMLYILVVDVIKTPQRLRVVMLVLPILAMIVVLVSLRTLLLVAAEKPLAAVRTLDSLLLVVPNDVLLLSVIMPLLLGAVWAMPSRSLLLLSGVCFVLSWVLCEMLQSRQAVALLLLGQMLVVVLMRPRWAVPVAALLVAIGVLLDGLTGWHLAQKIFMFPRTYVWHTAWTMFLDHPWTGQGPGLFGDLYFTFLAKAGYVLDTMPDRRPMLWAHNLYLEQLAERGMGGLLALLILLGASVSYAWRAWRQQVTNYITRPLAAGIFVAVLMLALSGIAEASLSRIWVSVLLLLLAALSIVIDELSQRRA